MQKIFELKNNNWIKTENYNPTKKDIILYDIVNGIMQPVGIGQF
jgi:hypothetical protein